jgi:hypothetical protein
MNQTIPEPIWEKQLGKFHLMEFPKAPNYLNCAIGYSDVDADEGIQDITFNFGDWGMDREEITEQDCLICCQAMLDCDANISVSSFHGNLEYAKNHFYEDEEVYE